MNRSAWLSKCEKHRFTLKREWRNEGLLYGYFGINPSTADANLDDATVRKWIGFTERNGGRGFIVGNVFSLRSPNVKDLALSADPTTPENDHHLEQIIRKVDVLVPCWGNLSKVPKRLHEHFGNLMFKLLESGKPVKCFGLTKSGDPKHPLMLGYSTELVEY